MSAHTLHIGIHYTLGVRARVSHPKERAPKWCAVEASGQGGKGRAGGRERERAGARGSWGEAEDCKANECLPERRENAKDKV